MASRAIGYTDLIDFTPTLSVAGAYVTGDYVGKSTAPESANLIRSSAQQNTAVLQSLVLIDKAAQGVALDIHFFDQTITVPTDNAAWAVTDAHLLFSLGHVSIAASDYSAGSNGTEATVKNIGLTLKGASGARAIFIAIVARGGPTYAAGDLTLRLGMLQD